MPETSFAARLKKLREAAHLTVAELSQAAGVHRDAIYRLEKGETTPLWTTIEKLCAALEISTDVFRRDLP